MLFNCFYAFMTALCAALIMVPFLRRWALDKGTVDIPDARKVHAAPTPRLGGIAIFLAFLFSALIFSPPSPVLRGLLAGALVVFATGLVDDLEGLTSRQKFLGQIIGALVAIAVADLWIHDLGNLFGLGRIVLPVWVGVPFTVFAVVGVCNAINLIDGLDGLAGGVSVLALAALALLGLLDGDVLGPLLAAALAGAILGFLKYNFYPARIFMGDTGSLTVGFLLAFFAVYLTQRSGSKVSPMLPVLILALPIFDAIWVMVRRTMRRISPFAPDKGHVHHKFLDLGLEHRMTVLVIYTGSLFWACSALLLHKLPEYALLVFLLATAVGSYLLLRHLLHHPDRYPLLRADSGRTLRASATFARCAALADRLIPMLSALLAGYALLALAAALAGGTRAWPLALLLAAGGAVLRLRSRDGTDFLLLLAYAAACLAAFVVWHGGEVGGFPVKRIGDVLLAVATVLIALKLLLRQPGELFLGSADFLALALLAFLVIVAQQGPLAGVALGGPLLRAILLILAVRTLASRGRVVQRSLIDAALVVLTLFAVAGLLR